MSQGNDFASYDSSAADSGSASEDVWFVAVSSDDIKQMSVDQLDEAFRLGLISAQTAVWTEGMEAWAPLGEVADLDSDESTSGDPAPAAEPAFASAFSAPAFSEPSSSMESAASQRAHEQSQQQNWRNPFESPFDAPASAPAQHASSNHHPSMGPSSFAPVTASYAPASPGLAQSTGPVALNVDEDMPPVNRGRSWRPERWLLAAAGVAAICVIAFNNSDLFSSGSAAAEKQASAASLAPRPYEPPADKEKGSTVLAAAKLDDGKDAPIGSLVPAHGDEDGAEKAAEPAAVPPSSLTPPSKSAGSSQEAVRGGMSKAFSGKKAAAKPAKASKATKARKPPSRASKSKKSVARTSSAFDPLNGSLP